MSMVLTPLELISNWSSYSRHANSAAQLSAPVQRRAVGGGAEWHEEKTESEQDDGGDDDGDLEHTRSTARPVDFK